MKLADLCDTATSYIGQIEIGDKFPSIEMIEKIAKSLQIQPYLLFLDEHEANVQAADLKPFSKGSTMPERVKKKLIEKLNGAITRIVTKL